VGWFTGSAARMRLASADVMSREVAMSPARESPSGHGERQKEPIDWSPDSTAVAITAAWLIAFACVALLTLLS